jgi:hypothetical protein
MDLQGIREALRRQPFEPFSICLADGRSVVEPLLIVSLDYNGKQRPRSNRRKRGND